MLQGFLDGSTSGNPQILSVAGFVGSLESWARFHKEWREARATAGIDYFHMTDFMSRQAKPYRGWTENKRNAIISHLLELINGSAVFAVGVAFRLDDYRTEIGQGKRSYKPYRFGAGLCIGRVARELAAAKINRSVMYVFEVGDEGEPAFRKSMAEIIHKLPKYRDEMRISSVESGTKNAFPALDAADFFAWQVSQWAQKMQAGKPARPTGYVGRLKMPLLTNMLQREHLREWATGNSPENRNALAAVYGVRIRREKERGGRNHI